MKTMSKMEPKKQEPLQRLRGLRPMDEEFMYCFFDSNIPLIQFVLRILTGKRDLVITNCWIQEDMGCSVGMEQLRVAAYGKDSAGKGCHCEIFLAGENVNPCCARCYSSMADQWEPYPGRRYDELSDTYTIFLLEKDVFGMGRPVYPVERMNVLTGEPFEDGKHILYVNTAYRDDSDIGRLMHDFNCTKAKEMYFDLFAERIRYLKKDPNGISEACDAIQKMEGCAQKG